MQRIISKYLVYFVFLWHTESAVSDLEILKEKDLTNVSVEGFT